MPGVCIVQEAESWRTIMGLGVIERSTEMLSRLSVARLVTELGWEVRHGGSEGGLYSNQRADLQDADARITVRLAAGDSADSRLTDLFVSPKELTIRLIEDGSLPDGWEQQVRDHLNKHDPSPEPAADPMSVEDLPSGLVPIPPDAPREARASRRPGHVFISYSRDDQAYVDKLVARLRKAGLTCWIDKSGIDYGDRWEDEIQTALDECAAVVVVMTHAAQASRWVSREIGRAEKMGKPTLPLLLEKDEEFFRLSDLRYESVVGGAMPSDGWVERLAQLVRS